MSSLSLLLGIALIETALGATYYVNPDNVEGRNGKTWNNAFTTLDSALDAAGNKVDEIWLKGNYTYTPNTTNRSDCFYAVNGISIYGGFIGDEDAIDERPTLNYYEYESILSGDISIRNGKSDNCYHVLTY